MPAVKISFTGLAGLLLAVLVCAPAFGAPVPGVEVEVRNHEGNFVAANLVDGDLSTAWVGGGTGVGPGKWIEFSFPGPMRLSSLKVANGHQGKGRFQAFRRLVRGVILYPDGSRQKFTLKPVPGVQTVRLESRVADTFRVIITGVDPDAGDEAMGKAKVAVSEMTVFGEAVDPSEVESVDTAAGAPQVAEEPLPAEKPEPRKAGPARKVKKAVPAVKPKPAAKQEQAAKPVQADKKAEPVKKAAPVKKAVPAKKVAPIKKAAQPGTKAKKAAKPTKAPAPSKGATYLRPVVGIPADKPLATGVISPWLDLELVAGIKRYFSHLTTLSDSYPDVFADSIRERERKAFLALQEAVRKEKAFGDHHIAMLELIGLNFDKPVEAGGGVAVHVHGPCRYYVGDRGFEFRVDTVITLVRENAGWRISAVRDR